MDKRTATEIEDLKRQWDRDPCWDLEETEGFEAYKDELKAYRLKSDKEALEHLPEYFLEIEKGRRNLDPHALYDRIVILERKIEMLEDAQQSIGKVSQ